MIVQNKLYIFKNKDSFIHKFWLSWESSLPPYEDYYSYRNSIYYNENLLSVECMGHTLKHFKLFMGLIRQGKYEKRN